MNASLHRSKHRATATVKFKVDCLRRTISDRGNRRAGWSTVVQDDDDDVDIGDDTITSIDIYTRTTKYTGEIHNIWAKIGSSSIWQ